MTGTTPNIFEDLRRVGTLKRVRLGQKPSDNALSKGAGVSRDTVGAWLRGERFPQQDEALLAVITRIRAEASRQGILETPVDGISGETVTDLLSEARWRDSWHTEQHRRTQQNRDGVERQQAQKALDLKEHRERLAALADAPRPIPSWDPQRLGVHPAISGHSPGRQGAGFVLPQYVPRAHDDKLRAHVVAGAADSADPLLVVVRGESCTGKTRSAFEAVRAAVPEDFDLLFPADSRGLLEALGADAVGPRSVLWLNEGQRYLASPEGEAAAAALLRRLDGHGPFIVITTMWSDDYKRLTDRPSPGTSDPHAQARELLSLARRIDVPRSFAGDLVAARSRAEHDLSLSAALESGGEEVTQTLAAGPDLVDHYEHPAGPHGVYGKALVSAAMDAHRLGVTGALPLAFLEAAAPGYLTDRERAEATAGWFIGALSHAQTLIKKIAMPLPDVPRPSGMGAQPGVVGLADYLQQHGRRTRWKLCPPATFWDAATACLTSAADLVFLAVAALCRGRLRYAATLYRKAADAGHTGALLELATLRRQAGDVEGSHRLYVEAGHAGSTEALRVLTLKCEQRGDHAGAEVLARRALAAGSMVSLWDLARTREDAGAGADAERLARIVLDSGDTRPLMEIAALRAARDPAGAEQLCREAADAGDSGAVLDLAARRLMEGDIAGFLRLASRASEAGHPRALKVMALQRENSGDREGAERLARRAADAGEVAAPWELARIREDAGDHEGAERLARVAADAGYSAGLWTLAQIREEAGDREAATRLYEAAADAGHPFGLLKLPELWKDAGQWEEAERLAFEATDAGDPNPLRRLAQAREAAGDTDAAERLYRAAADTGDPNALMPLADTRAKAGDREAAERLIGEAVDAGHPSALRALAQARGEPEDAYRRYGLEPDGTLSQPWPWPEPTVAPGDPT